MQKFTLSKMIATIHLREGKEALLLNWLVKFRSEISRRVGFLHLEIVSPSLYEEKSWTLAQAFDQKKNLEDWLNSSVYQELVLELENEKITDDSFRHLENQGLKQGVTELCMTFVKKDKVQEFCEWHKKIYKIESKFKGFQRVYLQSPENDTGEGSWMTLLQFDREENLEKWLSSKERQEVLHQTKAFVRSFESHRLPSVFSGWFDKRSLMTAPAMWKQTLLILLVLFPIVMLQFKYLNPQISDWNLSLKTFVGNAISVFLISWPLLPIAIYFLRWWLESNRVSINLIGIFLVFILYGIEIFLFWV